MRIKQKRPTSIDRLCVVGHPSRLGGADTELDHQIRCWQQMGIEVHICHTGPLDDNLRSMKLAERGCIYHEPRDWRSLEGFHVISFCNGDYLRSFGEIRQSARTVCVVIGGAVKSAGRYLFTATFGRGAPRRGITGPAGRRGRSRPVAD